MYHDITHELEYLKLPELDLERYDKDLSLTFRNIWIHDILVESKRIAFKQLYRMRERRLGSTHQGYSHMILSLKRLLEYDIGTYSQPVDKDDHRHPLNQIRWFIEERRGLLDRIFRFLDGIFSVVERRSFPTHRDFLTHRDKRNLVRPIFIHLDDIERLYLNQSLHEQIAQLMEFKTAQRQLAQEDIQ